MVSIRKFIYIPIIILLAIFGLAAFHSPAHAEDSVPPAGETQAGEIQTDETQAGEIQTDETQTDEIQTDETQTGEIQTDEIQTDEVQTGEIQTEDQAVDPAPAAEGAPVEVSTPPETTEAAPDVAAESTPEKPAETTVSAPAEPAAAEPEPAVVSKPAGKAGEETTGYVSLTEGENAGNTAVPAGATPQLVVLDQNGNSVPLATEEAGEALLAPDPYFYIGATKLGFTTADCNPGLAGDQGCVNPLQAAIDYISLRGLSPAGGKIYIENGDYASNLVINATAWSTNFHAVPGSLSLIGVVGFDDTTIGISENHTITGGISVQGMKSILLQALSFTGSKNIGAGDNTIAFFGSNNGVLTLIDVDVKNSGTGYGLAIMNHTGTVNLNMVDSSDNGNDGLYIDVGTAAPVNIKNSSFNRNGDEGIYIDSNSAVNLTGVTASFNQGYAGAHVMSKGLIIYQSIFNNNNDGYGLRVDANSLGGATLIQNSQFNVNAGMGLSINQNGNVDIKNIRASDNGSNGLWVDTCLGEPCGNLFTGNVSVLQSEFTGNVKTATDADPSVPFGGMVIQAKGSITLTDDYSGGNGNGSHPAYGARLLNNSGIFAVNVTGSGFGGNFQDGLSVLSKGMITLKDSFATDNTGNGTYLNNDTTGGTAGVSVLNTPDYVNLFNNNGSDGLEIHSKGTVLVTSSRANGNAETGFYIYAANGTGTVTLDGARGTTASGNLENGIWVISNGAITVKNMDASDNHYDGYNLNVLSGTGAVNVLVTIPGWHNGLQNNFRNGLTIISSGVVVVQKTFANNNREYGAYIDNTGGTGNVTISDSDFNNNAFLDTGGDVETGLFIQSKGAIALTNINANDNGNSDSGLGVLVAGNGVWLDNSTSSTAKAITITKGGFSNNFGSGLDVTASGAITYKNGSVNNNNEYGANLFNHAGASNQNVTVEAVNFSGGGVGLVGLYIKSRGNIQVTATDVNGFDGNGMDLINTYGTGTVTVSGTASWWRYFGNNAGSGIAISTNGAVSLGYLSANDNGQFGAYIQTNGTTAPVTITMVNFMNNGLDSGAIDKYGVKVIAKGNITLDKVQVTDNKGYGALLDNHAGTGTVTVKSATGAEIRNNNQYGLWVLSKGNITLTNIHVHDNGEVGHTDDFGAWLDNSFGTSGSVAINNSMYTAWSNNRGFGLQVYSNGAITINLVDANRNYGTNGTFDNSTAVGAATPAVTITNSWFNESQDGFGLLVTSKGNITLTNVDSCGNNKVSGAFGGTINNAVAGGKGNVTITGVSADDKNAFNDNIDYGLYIVSNGTITIKWVEALNNGRYGASIDNSGAATPMAVTMTESYFNDNAKTLAGFGLMVASKGNITGTRVFAQNNGNWDTAKDGDGIFLDNCLLSVGYCTGTGSVTLSGAGGYSNYGDGLTINSYGAINLSDVGAGWNNGNGGAFYNDFSKRPNPALPAVKSSAGITITLPAGLSTEWGIFSENGGYGLAITSNGAISVAYVNVNNNRSYTLGASINNTSADTPMPVTIIKSKFNGNANATYGVYVVSNGAITFTSNEVTGTGGAYSNLHAGAFLRNTTATSPQNVTVTSSGFSNNATGAGLYIITKGNTLLTNLTAFSNGYSGVVVDAKSGSGTITLNGSKNSFSGNANYGVAFVANGNVSVTNFTAEYNSGEGLYIATYLAAGTGLGTGTVTLTNANINHNAMEGLFILSNGVTNLSNVSVLGNGWGSDYAGAFIQTHARDINITNSSFSGNYAAGIQSNTGGSNTLKLVGTSFYGNDVNNTGDKNLYYTGPISIS